jgi:hypothetical protein
MRSFLLLAALTFSSVSRADEIEDALKAALAAHQSGKTAEAAAAIKKANDLLAEKAVAGLGEALPKAIGEWTAGKLESQSLSSAGGGHSFSRSYKQGSKEAGNEKRGTAVVTVDSPLLQKVGSFLSNPQIGALLGAKPLKVGPHSAIHIEKQGLIQFIVKERYLVAIEGKKLKKDELVEIAAGIKTEVFP